MTLSESNKLTFTMLGSLLMFLIPAVIVGYYMAPVGCKLAAALVGPTHQYTHWGSHVTDGVYPERTLERTIIILGVMSASGGVVGSLCMAGFRLLINKSRPGNVLATE